MQEEWVGLAVAQVVFVLSTSNHLGRRTKQICSSWWHQLLPGSHFWMGGVVVISVLYWVGTTNHIIVP